MHIALVGLQQHFFHTLCDVIGRPEMKTDFRFVNNGARLTNRLDLKGVLEAALANRPMREWLELFEAHGVPCAPVNDIAAVITDPQIAARSMIVTTDDGHMVPGNPVKVSGWPDVNTKTAVPAAGDIDAHGPLLRKALL